jgi:hypothetical protein
MNIGKESSRAECARLRSRHHCVTTRRAASTRQRVRHLEMGSATVPVAVFGVAPKTLQQTDLSNDDSGATPEPARGTRALPPHRPSQNEYRKREFKSGMCPSSLLSSLRYDAASCFNAARF